MPEFLRLLPPDEARALLLSHLANGAIRSEQVETAEALDRVTVEDIVAPHALPEFARSSVDGYAVLASETFGATESLPAYLKLRGEIPMGAAPAFLLKRGECGLIHTGGMLPDGADAVVMLENAQPVKILETPAAGARASVSHSDMRHHGGPRPRAREEVEIHKAVASGENVIKVGEDVVQGQIVIARGARLRPAEIGGLMALGLVNVRVAAKPRVGLISSGDEVVDPQQVPLRGQVRDVNAYTLASLVTRVGGEAVLYGIVPDELSAAKRLTKGALDDCDMLIISGGSSASARDMTAELITDLGSPGVLVHGINVRPGKPTILGVCGGKAVIGLPGNPVSALVIGYLFVVPVVGRLLGLLGDGLESRIVARLTTNLPSQAGREDWWPVRLSPGSDMAAAWLAEPIFGKSNLIFSLVAADGLIRISPDSNGLGAGEIAEVLLM